MFLKFPIIMISAVIFFLNFFLVIFNIYVRVILEFLRDVFFNITETVTTICVLV